MFNLFTKSWKQSETAEKGFYNMHLQVEE